MKYNKNTPELWDDLWKETSKEQDLVDLQKEENSIRWQRINSLVIEKFSSFKNLRIIEVGAGSGTNALLFARRGSKVTILDYSKNAINRSKSFFKRNNVKANFVLADVLSLPDILKGKYDIAMSFGLSEHFIGKKRYNVIKSHFDLINKKGLVIISVPNKLNPPYRINKFLKNLLRMWEYGEEYPFSRKEFITIARKLGVKKINFIGDSFWKSFRFINPFLIIKKIFKIKTKIRKEKGSFLDPYISYSLVFIGSS